MARGDSWAKDQTHASAVTTLNPQLLSPRGMPTGLFDFNTFFKIMLCFLQGRWERRLVTGELGRELKN